jgi:hypothetical protein
MTPLLWTAAGIATFTFGLMVNYATRLSSRRFYMGQWDRGAKAGRDESIEVLRKKDVEIMKLRVECGHGEVKPGQCLYTVDYDTHPFTMTLAVILEVQKDGTIIFKRPHDIVPMTGQVAHTTIVYHDSAQEC